jgi:hypothetical protein
MFKTSTSIIKGQIPGVSLSHLLNFYKRELNYQNVSQIKISGNTISFSNKIYKFIINRYTNKFSNFSFGQIKIIESEKEFIVHMQANMARLFINVGIIAFTLTLFLLLSSGFNVITFLLGIGIFALLTIINNAITNISFPVYFINLRNKIQQELEIMQI